MSHNQNTFYYQSIPTAVLYHPKVKITTARLYGMIEFLSSEKGCFASSELLANRTNQSLASVNRNLKILEEAGFIERTTFTKIIIAEIGRDTIVRNRLIKIILDRNKIPDYVP